MKIRIKSNSSFRTKRIEGRAIIDNVIINEDLLNPDKESASIFFRGKDCSGILNLSTSELKKLSGSTLSTLGLVRRMEEIPEEPTSFKPQTKSRKKSRKK